MKPPTARLAGLWTLLLIRRYKFRCISSDVHGALCVGVRTATVSSHTVYHDVKVLYKF